MSLTIAGSGPGNIKFLTQEVIRSIEQADIVAGFERIADDVKILRKDIYKLKTISSVLELPIQTRHVLVLASGDPCFFGITEFLKRENVKIDRVLPGISSMQYLMCKLKKQWQNFSFYSFHGREVNFSEIKNKENFFILTDKTNNPNNISKCLKEKGFKGKIFVAYNLSYPDEIIEEYKIGDEITIKSFLNIVMIQNEKY